MNIINLSIGILLILTSIIFLLYKIRFNDNEEDYDDMLFSFDIKLYVGILMFFLLGVTMIYRELN